MILGYTKEFIFMEKKIAQIMRFLWSVPIDSQEYYKKIWFFSTFLSSM
jgi:hypothetical protein